MKLERILLVYPPTSIYTGAERKRIGLPLGLASIASALKNAGYDVSALDASLEDFECEEDLGSGRIRFGMSLDKIKNFITELQPDVVGVSGLFTSQAENAHAVCRLAKEVRSDTVTILGGAYATSETEECLKDPSIDFAVLGEGDEIVVRLLDQLNQGGSLDDVSGIAYSEKGEIREQPRGDFIADVDALPMPDRDLFPVLRYSDVPCAHGTFKRKPFASIFSSRGCPYRCTFCFSFQMLGRGFRGQSPSRVLDEIELLVEKYGIRELHFEDDVLTYERDRAMEIFQGMIDRKLDVAWTTPNAVAIANLDRELLITMKKSGCYSIIVAVESGSQRVLTKVIQKPVTLKTAEQIMHTLRDVDLPVAAYWMLGMPGETKQDIEDTIVFAEKLKSINPDLYSSFSIYTPFKGTQMYDVAMENDYLKFDEGSKELKYCFGHIDTPEFDREWITMMRRVAWQRANHIESDEDLRTMPKMMGWIGHPSDELPHS